MSIARAILPGLLAAVVVACGPAAGLPGATMSITDARAYQLPGSEHPILVAATITNTTGHEDFLTGGASSLGGRVQLDGTTGLALPEPTDVGTGLNDMVRMEFWRIGPGETITLAGGGGHLTVIGPSHPAQSGDVISVTFAFRQSPPVTIRVPVD